MARCISVEEFKVGEDLLTLLGEKESFTLLRYLSSVQLTIVRIVGKETDWLYNRSSFSR